MKYFAREAFFARIFFTQIPQIALVLRTRGILIVFQSHFGEVTFKVTSPKVTFGEVTFKVTSKVTLKVTSVKWVS